MTSLRYKLLKPVIRRLSHKEIYSMSRSELEAWLEANAQSRDGRPPEGLRKRLKIKTMQIGGCTCYIMEPQTGSQNGAPIVLFLHGGGFIFEAREAHWAAAAKIVEQTGAQLWFFNYPLMPEHQLVASLEALMQAYAKMLATIKAEEISVVGDSAGAALTLLLGHRLSEADATLPMPARLIVCSPPQLVAPTPEIRSEMDTVAGQDIMLSTAVMDTLYSLSGISAADPPYYTFVLAGDFSAFPPITAFCGTDEIFYPLMPGFVDAVQSSGGQIAIEYGQGLCHVYPYVPFAPEGKAALGKLIAVLSSKSTK